jgi:hypothetical protein
MGMLPRQFKALVETLRNQLVAIREAIERQTIQKSFKEQEHANANRDKASATQQREVARIIASAIKTANEEVPAYEKAQRNKEYGQQRKLIWAAWFTFAAAVAYGAVAALQDYLTWKVIKQSERAMEMGQRPWLEFRFGDSASGDTGSVTVQIAANAPISVPGQFVNIGKTPALDIKGVTVLQVVDTGKDPDMPDRKTGISLTALGEPVPAGAKWTKDMNGRVFEEAPIFPGQHSQFPVFRVKPSIRYGFVEPLILLPDEYAKLTGKSAYISVWGKVWYEDIFGVSHWTQFCSTQGAGFEVTNEKCVNYGDVDKNPQ